MKVENNLDTDKVRGLVWRLAFPSMLAQFVNVMYSIVDRMYIGNIPEIGALALAGVGICGPVVTLISSFASWIGVGGAPLMSIRLGQKNERAAAQMVANCFALLTGMALIIMTVSYLFKDQLLVFFGAGPAIFPYANQYMSWYLTGTAFALLSAGMNQFIICQGFATVGMKSVVLGAVSNIVLDPVFIFGMNMGVRGAAIATVLSQMASCIYVLLFLFGKRPLVRITFGGYRWKTMKQVLLVGLSPFLIIASDSLLIIIMNMVISSYGGPERSGMLLTCNTIVQSFMLIITMPLGGITGGTQTVMGYNYGAAFIGCLYNCHVHYCTGGTGIFCQDIYKGNVLCPGDGVGNPDIYIVYHPSGCGIYGGRRIYRYGNRKGGHQPVHVQEVGLFPGNDFAATLFWGGGCVLF